MLPNVLKQQRLPEGQASLCFTHNLHYNFIVLLPLHLLSSGFCCYRTCYTFRVPTQTGTGTVAGTETGPAPSILWPSLNARPGALRSSSRFARRKIHSV